MTQTEAYGGLAQGIILQATIDWRALCRNLLDPKPKAEIVRVCETFDSLRRFFKSEWCDSLCIGYDPLVILAGLERELKETENKLLEVVNG